MRKKEEIEQLLINIKNAKNSAPIFCRVNKIDSDILINKYDAMIDCLEYVLEDEVPKNNICSKCNCIYKKILK